MTTKTVQTHCPTLTDETLLTLVADTDYPEGYRGNGDPVTVWSDALRYGVGMDVPISVSIPRSAVRTITWGEFRKHCSPHNIRGILDAAESNKYRVMSICPICRRVLRPQQFTTYYHYGQADWCMAHLRCIPDHATPYEQKLLRNNPAL